MSLFSPESHAFELEVERVKDVLIQDGCPINQARWRAEQAVWSSALAHKQAPQCPQR